VVSIGEMFPMKSEEMGVMDLDAPLSITIGSSFLLLQKAEEL